MSILENHFYHNTVTTYMKVFGAIFDKIKVVRPDDKMITVPIALASGQKYNIRNQQNPDPSAVKYKQTLPRMSYGFTGWRRDPVRARNKLHKISDFSSGDSIVQTQYMRVPYTFNVKLDVKVQYMDDLLQIFEQISVYFNPSLQVTVIDNPDISGQTAITITMTGSNSEDVFEGSFEQSEEITMSFDFELEGYLYMPTSEGGLITHIELNYKDLDSEQLIEQVVIDAD